MIVDGLWQNPLAPQYRREGYWRDEVLTDFVSRWAQERGDEIALVDGPTRLTWAHLWGEVETVAAALLNYGVREREVVSTQLPNGADIVRLHLAIEYVGAIHNPLAVQLRERELDQIAGLLGPRLVIHPDDDQRTSYSDIHSKTAAGARGATRTVTQLTSARPEGTMAVARAKSDATRAAFILNTSGTVAMKGVVHTHENAMYGTRVVGHDILGLQAGDTVLCVIPVTWGGGLEWGLRIAMHLGAKLVTIPRWDADLALKLLETEGVDYLYGPPTVATDLVRAAGGWRPVKPLKMICAGAPIPRTLVSEARDNLGMALLPGYGQTEHFHSTLARLSDPVERVVNSDGWALPGVEIRILDQVTKQVLPPGEIGEIECRGPHVSAGYWSQPDLTDQIFHNDGWQVTQDLGSLDEAGSLRIGGRKRDIIIRGGLNVSPRELEELLFKHPEIDEVAVMGRPDPRYGERVCAFIVPSPGASPTVETLGHYLGSLGLARFKHPEQLIVLDAMPLTANGKVSPQALRAILDKCPAIAAPSPPAIS